MLYKQFQKCKRISVTYWDHFWVALSIYWDTSPVAPVATLGVLTTNLSITLLPRQIYYRSTSYD